MIYTNTTLKIKYKNYSNILQKISLETKKGKLVRIKRGVYSDDVAKDGPALANFCYAPSYISFEYALSYYGLIPEKVSTYTSATFNKHRSKLYQCDQARFEYHDIPKKVFPIGLKVLTTESGFGFRIASEEKALCDELYSKYSVNTLKVLAVLLFDDLRIDEEEFDRLDKKGIIAFAPYYHSVTLDTLVKYLKKKGNKYESDY